MPAAIPNGILFFRKNYVDLDFENPTITVTDSVASDTGSTITDLMRNRNNRSGWATTDSTDAANTTLEVDLIDEMDIDSIFLIGMNFASYTLKYWNGSSYTDFATAIDITGNTHSTKYHSVTKVSSSKIQLVIRGTFVANDDKILAQFVITEKLGQFQTGFRITKPEVSQARRLTKMLSGKGRIIRNLGGFSCSLRKNNVTNGNDLELIETLFDLTDGFLVWLCGGETSQFRPGPRYGYRLEDLFLMDNRSEYEPEYEDGHYVWGNDITLDLVEIV